MCNARHNLRRNYSFVGETAGEYFIKPHHEVDFWAGFWIGVISCLGSMTVNLIF